MRKNPNVVRTWTLVIPTDTMPAVNHPKAMHLFMTELSDICTESHGHTFLSVCGDYLRCEVRLTFRYWKAANEFAEMWFMTRARVLAEAGRDRRLSDIDNSPF